MSELQVDLKDPDLFVDGPPHDIFTRLRREYPIYWNPEVDGPGFWALTRYADIVEVSRRPDIFSSARSHGGHRIVDEIETSPRDAQASMISMDPPEHTRHRRMVSPALSGGRLATLEGTIRQRLRELIDRVAARGQCEFVTAIAAELPIQVLAELLGVPQRDRDKLFRWSDTAIGEDDPDLRPTPLHAERCEAEMAAYALTLWSHRLENPGEDLVSLMAHSRTDGRRVSLERFLSTFALMVIAGNETTRHAIAGGVLALARHPDQRQRLLDDPTLIPSAVDEIVRWVSPVYHMRRTATRDTEIRGREIAAGDKVVLWYAAANRDEEIFDDPFRFDVGRRGPAHLGFGIGPHKCLGSRLANLQLRLVLEELLPRLPDIELSGPVLRIRSNFIHGIKQMPIRFTPRE